MESLKAFAMGEMNRGKPMMVFDWHKAAKLIREKNPSVVSAGLRSDWEWTGGTIYENGAPDVDSYTYLASTWATPEIEIDGDVFDCFVMQSETDGWDSGTKWPASALEILGLK